MKHITILIFFRTIFSCKTVSPFYIIPKYARIYLLNMYIALLRRPLNLPAKIVNIKSFGKIRSVVEYDVILLQVKYEIELSYAHFDAKMPVSGNM